MRENRREVIAAAQSQTAAPLGVWRGLSWLPPVLQAGVAAVFVLLAIDSPGDRFGPQVAALTAGVWLLATGSRILWSRNRGGAAPFGPLSFNSLYLFLLLSSAVYTLLILDQTDVPVSPSPDAPEFLPGLFTDLTNYYLALQASVVLFISWYGQSRGRLLETAVAVQVVYVSVLFEPLLRSDTGVPLLWGNLLVMAAVWLTRGREEGLLTFQWTPFGLPLLALVAAAGLATVTATYVYASLFIAAKIAAFVLLALLIMNLIRTQRQIWAIGAALVLPAVGMAIVLLYRLVEIGNHMGIDFAIRNRFTFVGVIGSNASGLGFVVALLLVIGAIFLVRRFWLRLGLALLGIPLVPAILALYSPITLAALAVGLVIMLITANARQLLTKPRQLLSRQTALVAVPVVAVIAAAVVIPNPYVEELGFEITDPTGGSSRSEFWPWAFADFRHNPVLGIGLTGDYAPRAQYVPEFPLRDVTRMGERRFLIGGDGNQWRIFVWGHPHNIFLGIGETMGTVGLGALFWLLGSLARQGFGLIRSPLGRERWFMTTALAGIGAGLGWSVFALGQNVTIIPLSTWVLLGLLGAGYRMTHSTAQADQRPRASLLKPVQHAWRRVSAQLGPAWAPLAALAIAIAFLGMVARPVVAQIMVGHAEREVAISDAIDGFKLARRLEPLHSGYLQSIGQLYLRSGQMEKAVGATERLVEVERQRAAPHLRLGWVYWLSGDLEAATAQFERAVELDPWSSTPDKGTRSQNHVALALAYYASGRRADATHALQEALVTAPSSVHDQVWLAAESEDRIIDPGFAPSGDKLRRQGLIRAQLLLAPGELPPPSQDSGMALRLSEVLEAMHERARTDLTSNARRGQDMLLTIARIYRESGLLEEARDTLLELRALLPEVSYVHYNLGLVYSSMGDLQRAKAAFLTALERASSSAAYDLYKPFSHLELGILYLWTNENELALEQLRVALDAYRWAYFPGAYEALITAEQRSGNRAEAELLTKRRDYRGGPFIARPPPPDKSDSEESDATRQTDLARIQEALEQYFQDKGVYPETGGNIQTFCLFTDVDAGCDLQDMLSPLVRGLGYWYLSNGSTYTLFARRESELFPECREHPAELRGADSLLCVQGP